MFDEFNGLKGLNDEQKNAILNSLNKNSLVLAGAGSGKTRVLITRIEYLLKVLKVEPSQIMAITFTEKAAKELMTRVEKVTSYADEMTVGTYHSICLKLIKEFGEEIGLDSDMKCLDKERSKYRIRQVLVDMGIVASNKIINNYQDKMSRLKNKFINPNMYRKIMMDKYNGFSESFKNGTKYEFIEFYSLYQKKNLEDGYLDFDDMIMYAMALIQSSKNVQEYIRDKYKYIHADEVQDSNEGNIRLLNEFSKHANLFMVGDLDQSIYGFRDARPDYFLKLQELGEIEIFKLQQNFRSTQMIVNASNALIENNTNRIPKTCFSEGAIGDIIDYYNFNTNEKEAEFVADEIKMYKNFFAEDEEFSYKYSDFMVLFRTNKQAEIFEKVFLNEGVPYVLVGANSFVDKAEVRDCLAFLRLYVNRKSRASLIRSLKNIEGVGDATIKEVIKLFDEDKDILEILKEYKPKREKARKGLDFLFQLLTLVNNKPTAVLEFVTDKMIKKLEEKGTDKDLAKAENIKELLKLAKKREDAGMIVQEFVEQMDLLIKAKSEEVTDAVQIITVHSSKGLEARVVFVSGMNEEIFPHVNSLNSDDDIEEERRCMYVACTRPKEKLYLTSYRKDGNKTYESSRFISEIPREYMSITVAS